MLTISDPLGTEQVEDYYEEEYQQGDYYLGRDEEGIVGTWHGAAAERLGLTGMVGREDYVKLANGQSPDERQIVKNSKGKDRAEHRSAWDATTKAPKSFSLVGLIGSDERILMWHARANRAAMKVLERHAQVRAGADRKLNLPTGELAYATFMHTENRNLEPLIHSHNVVMNLTWSETAGKGQGDWRALQEKGLFGAQWAATLAYRSELAALAREGGYQIYIDEFGAPQIEGVSREVIEAFSTRRAGIEIELWKAEENAKAQGRTLSVKDRAIIADHAAKKTRDPKQKNIDRGKLKEEWLRKSEIWGIDFKQLVTQARERAASRTPEDLALEREEKEKATFEAVNHAVEHLTERDSVTSQEELEQNCLENYQYSGLVTTGSVREELDRRVASGDLVREESADGNHRYTTLELQRLEREMLSIVRRGKGMVEAIGTHEERDQAKAAEDERRYRLNTDQQKVFEFIGSSADQFISVHGKAGVGKSFTFKKFADFAEARGYTVRAFAPTHPAVGSLIKEGLEDTSTVQSHVKSKHGFSMGGGLNGTETGKRQEIWLVDEAGMLGVRDMHALLSKARDEYARVVLGGDRRQFSSVPGGRAYAQILDDGIANVELNRMTRQKYAAQFIKTAVKEFSNGKVREAMALLYENGKVLIVPDEVSPTGEKDDSKRYQTIAELYVKHRGEVLVVTATNEERRTANWFIREALKEEGEVKADGVTTKIYANLNVTQADRKQAGNYAVGNMVRFDQVCHQELRRHAWYRVEAVDLGKNTLTVADENGKTITYNPKEHYGISDVYQVEEREFARGDLIQFRGQDESVGIKSGEVATIIAADREGRLVVRTQNGALVGISLDNHKTLDHAYATTGHSAQSRTVKTAIVLSTSFHREEVVNLASIYVGSSRTRIELFVVGDDYDGMVRAQERKYGKAAALDLSPSKTVSNGNQTSTREVEKPQLAVAAQSKNAMVASHTPEPRQPNTWETFCADPMTRQDLLCAAREYVEASFGSPLEGRLQLDDRWHYLDKKKSCGYRGTDGTSGNGVPFVNVTIHWFKHGEYAEAFKSQEALKTLYEQYKLAGAGDKTIQGRYQEQQAKWQAMTQVRQAEAKSLEASEQEKRERHLAEDVKLWEKLPPSGVSRYLERKGVAETAAQLGTIRYADRMTAAMITDSDGNTRGLQKILDNGDKIYTEGMEKKGGFIRLGELPVEPDKTVMCCEGLATGLSLYQAADCSLPVVCALDAGNLDSVVGALRDKFGSDLKIVIAADNDQWKANQLHPQSKLPIGNTGLIKAHGAALRHNCQVIAPDFTGLKVDGKPTDFNDLQKLAGNEVVRQQMAAPMGADVRYAFYKAKESDQFSEKEQKVFKLYTSAGSAWSKLKEEKKTFWYGLAKEEGRLGEKQVVDRGEALFVERFMAWESSRESGDELRHQIEDATRAEPNPSREREFEFLPGGRIPLDMDRDRMQTREILGQELTLTLQLQHLRCLKEELIAQAELRRFSVTSELVERDSSHMDLEARARVRARLVVEEFGAKGEEKRGLRFELQSEERNKNLTALAQIDQEFKRQLARLDSGIAKKEGALGSISWLSERLRDEQEADGKPLPLPFVERRELDRYHEEAVRRGDLVTVERLATIRREQAVEFHLPEHTPSSASRLLGQLRMAEIGRLQAQKRVEDFDRGNRFWRWKVNGEEWSLVEIEKSLERKQGEVIFLEKKLALATEKLAVAGANQRLQQKLARTEVELKTAGGELHKLTETRKDILKQAGEMHEELAADLARTEELKGVLTGLSSDLAGDFAPTYQGFELIGMERAAAFLKDPELVLEFERESGRFLEADNPKRTWYTRIEESDLAARATAREFIAGLDSAKARTGLGNFERYHGRDGDWVVLDAMEEPGQYLETLKDRELFGQEQVLKFQIREMTGTLDALREQAKWHRHEVTDEGIRRESSHFDLERKAKLTARAEADLLGLKGEAKKEYVREAVARETARLENTLGQVDERSQEKILKLEAGIELLEEKLKGVSERAELKRSDKYLQQGAAVPNPLMSRKSLDYLHEQAVKQKDTGTIRELQSIRRGLADEFHQGEFTPEGAGRVIARACLAEVDLRTAEKRLDDFDHGNRFWTWKIGDEEWSLSEVERLLERKTADLRFFDRKHEALEKLGPSVQGTPNESRITQDLEETAKAATHLRVDLVGLETVRVEIGARISETRQDLTDAVDRHRELLDALHDIRQVIPEDTAPAYTGYELVRLEQASAFLKDPWLLYEYEQVSHQFVEAENLIRNERTQVETTDLAARAQGRELVAGIESEKAHTALEKFERYHGRETDWVVFDGSGKSQSEMKILWDRELFGQEQVLTHQVRELGESLAALRKQEDLRRYGVTDETIQRETSYFDLERRAKLTARVEAERLELFGEEKKAFIREAVAKELERLDPTRMQVYREYLEKVLALETRMELLGEKLQLVSERAETLRNEYQIQGKPIPDPIISRKSLDYLTEQAVRHQDIPTLKELHSTRTALAAEFRQPEFTPEGAGRITAQTRMAELGLLATEKRLHDFERSRHIRSWKVGGEERSVVETERAIDRKTTESHYLERKQAGLEQFIAQGKQAVAGEDFSQALDETVLALTEIQAELKTLKAVRGEIQAQIDIAREELTESVDRQRELVQVLGDIRQGLAQDTTPIYKGFELLQFEQSAGYLKNAGLLKEYEVEAGRFTESENGLRREDTFIRETDLAGRAEAREILAGIESGKADSALEKFIVYYGESRDFIVPGHSTPLSAFSVTEMEVRETLGRELALSYQIRDLETTHAALLEQAHLRRYIVENESLERETSHFDLERRAKLRAKAEAERLELKGDEKKAFMAESVRGELEQHHPTVGAIEWEYAEQLWKIEARLETLQDKLGQATEAADQVRMEYGVKGSALPDPYLSRKTLDALQERFVRNHDLEAIRELETIRERQAGEFGAPEHIRESAARLLAETRLAAVDSELAEKRLDDFERARGFWTWKIGEEEWSLNEVERAIDRQDWTIGYLEDRFGFLDERLDGSRSLGQALSSEAELDEDEAEYQNSLNEKDRLAGIRDEIKERINATRLDLEHEVSDQREFRNVLQDLQERAGITTAPDYTGYELGALERAAQTLQKPDLLEEYERAADKYVASDNLLRSKETQINREDLAGRAAAREVIAALDVEKALKAVRQFELYKESTRITLEDGSRGSLRDFEPGTLGERMAQHFSEALDGSEGPLKREAQSRLELVEAALAQKTAAVFKGLEEKLERQPGIMAGLGLKLVKGVERSLGETEEDFTRRKGIETAIAGQENALRENLVKATAYHEKCLELRDRREQELAAQDKELPPLVYTTRDAIRLEQAGIAKNDEILYRAGLDAAERARKLKEEFGSAHPLERKAEYDQEKSYQPRVELEPVRREIERRDMEAACIGAHNYLEQCKANSIEHEMKLEAAGIELPEPLFTTREAVQLEAHAISTGDEELHLMALVGAEEAARLKNEFGNAHPLTRSAEYLEPKTTQIRIELEPVQREMERGELKARVENAVGYQDAAREVREGYDRDLKSQGLDRPEPLFTTREAVQLETHGIQRQDENLQLMGLVGAEEAARLKTERGNAHPLARSAEYLEPKATQIRIELEPVQRELERQGLVKQIEINECYEGVSIAVRDVHEQELKSQGREMPQALFTTQEAVKIEHTGIAGQDGNLEKMGIDAAKTAHLLKKEYGYAHPLGRKAEYEQGLQPAWENRAVEVVKPEQGSQLELTGEQRAQALAKAWEMRVAEESFGLEPEKSNEQFSRVFGSDWEYQEDQCLQEAESVYQHENAKAQVENRTHEPINTKEPESLTKAERTQHQSGELIEQEVDDWGISM